MWDVIIIGSGPAGLSAAIYAKRAGFSALVLEKAPMSGGQILNTSEVDNYPGLQGISGLDMGMKFREHAEYMQAEFIEDEAVELRVNGDIREVRTAGGEICQARAVIIAAGASHARLGVPGEEELSGRGVSWCAACDGAFFRNKVTAVAGGGDVAAEDAVFLAGLCKKVYVIHRRDRLRAAKILQEKLFSLPNVEILWDSAVEKISGADRVEDIYIVNKKTGAGKNLPVDGIFIAAGIRPQSEWIPDFIKKDENGYLVAGEDCRTNIDGIFAAGDIRSKRLRQVVTAAADGANAVASAEEYFLR